MRPPPAPPLCLDLARAFEVAFEGLPELAGEARIPDAEVDFVVELKRTVVEVDRADHSPSTQSVLACSIVGSYS